MMVCFFEAVDRPQPVQRDVDWLSLVGTLTRIRPIAGSAEERGSICPLWAPVRLRDGGRRRAADVVEVTALSLDYDDGLSMHDALDRWHGYERVAHTTWRNQPESPRSRLVMPLATPIPGELWAGVYRWVLDADGREGDTQCQDPSRQYYLPAVGSGGPQAARHRPGRWLDLMPVAALVARQMAAQRAEAEARRAAARRKLRSHVATVEERDRQARQALEIDSAARERLGVSLGGRVVQRNAGVVVSSVRCPACGRPSVWWVVDPQRWRGCGCEHRNSCGWQGRLYDLALAS